jgi:hypothetical protein
MTAVTLSVGTKRFKLEIHMFYFFHQAMAYFGYLSKSLIPTHLSSMYIYNMAPKATAAATPRPLAIAVGIAPLADPAPALAEAVPVAVAVAPFCVAGMPGPPRDLQVPETIETTAASYEMEQMFKQLFDASDRGRASVLNRWAYEMAWEAEEQAHATRALASPAVQRPPVVRAAWQEEYGLWIC